MFESFVDRSYQQELIDTGDYTPEQYERFLRDIRIINRYIGDERALKRTLLSEISRRKIPEFSVLDVGAGSGELLRVCAKFARKNGKETSLLGLELNPRSAESIREESADFNEIKSIRGDALSLPFANNSFDYAICSLFMHHFRENDIVAILKKMSRIARRKIFVIDLHRHPVAYGLYKIFTAATFMGYLVKEDGALSVKRGFKPSELQTLATQAGLLKFKVERHFPFRLVLEAEV